MNNVTHDEQQFSQRGPVMHIDGLVQERRNSSALAMELHLSCTNPPIYESVNLATIGSDNGLSPVRRQAIIWINVGLSLYWNEGNRIQSNLN